MFQAQSKYERVDKTRYMGRREVKMGLNGKCTLATEVLDWLSNLETAKQRKMYNGDSIQKCSETTKS
jgi:hypothetical protein